MKFEWNEEKRKSNIAKHGLDFVDSKYVFDSVTFTFVDDRFDYGEQRFIKLGIMKGMVVAIAHTEKDDVIRIISMRKPTKNEQKIYY